MSSFEIISFREAALEAACRQELQKPNGPMRRLDMAAITGLDLRDSEVHDLTDLSYCTHLRILSLEGTQARDLSPLSTLTALETLSMNVTPTVDLSPLRSLQVLRHLYAGKTNVTDLSPLIGLSQLRVVSCAYSPVSDIRPLLTLRTNGGLKNGRVILWGAPLSWEARNIHAPMLSSLDVEVLI